MCLGCNNDDTGMHAYQRRHPGSGQDVEDKGDEPLTSTTHPCCYPYIHLAPHPRLGPQPTIPAPIAPDRPDAARDHHRQGRFPPRAAAYDTTPLPPGLRAFTNWALGPAGPPRLRVLASRNFAHSGRYAATQVLLCRKAPGEWAGPDAVPEAERRRQFRHVADDDWSLRDYVQGKMDVLAACTGEKLALAPVKRPVVGGCCETWHER